MPSIFPYLISYTLLSPFLLRLVAGAFFTKSGYLILTTGLKGKRSFFEFIGMKPAILFAYLIGIVEFTSGVLLLMGLWTQLVALILAIIASVGFLTKLSNDDLLEKSASTYFIMFVILLSLIITGSGFFGMDTQL